MGVHQDEKIVAADYRKRALRKSRKWLIAGGVVAAAALPAAAWAFITLTGTGSAEAKVGEVKQLTVSDAGFTRDLFPGTSTDFVFNVANPNGFPVKVTDIAATSITDFAGGGCPGGQNLTGAVAGLGTNVALGANAKVITGNGSTTITVPNAVTLSTAATGPCGFKIAVKITGLQQAAS